jgi:hypothetical protein
MGRATYGRVQWSPDGSLGVVAQADGSLGIFTVDEDLNVSVVETRWDGGFYAGNVWFDPSGERAYVVDGNWEESGGGVWEVTFDCSTGAPETVGRILAARNPSTYLPLPDDPDRALLTGFRAPGGEPDHALSLLDRTSHSALSSADLFPYEDPIPSDTALLDTSEGGLVVVGDNSLFAGASNRIAAAWISGDTLVPAGDLELEDPVSLAASPFGDALLVSSGFGDTLAHVRLGADPEAPLEPAGAPTWRGARPSLPADLVVIRRGSLEGLVLLSELEGVRRLRFSPGGDLEDLGLSPAAGGYVGIMGAIGVQP